MRTFKQKYKDEKVWYKKVLILDMFHCFMEQKHGRRWTMQLTANSMEVSVGTVSEDIKIAKALRQGKEFDSRAHALRKLKKNA